MERKPLGKETVAVRYITNGCDWSLILYNMYRIVPWSRQMLNLAVRGPEVVKTAALAPLRPPPNKTSPMSQIPSVCRVLCSRSDLCGINYSDNHGGHHFQHELSITLRR